MRQVRSWSQSATKLMRQCAIGRHRARAQAALQLGFNQHCFKCLATAVLVPVMKTPLASSGNPLAARREPQQQRKEPQCVWCVCS